MAEVRTSTAQNDGATKAFADVTITLGVGGSIKINGYSIRQVRDKPIWVASPSRQWKQKFFDVVTASGRIRQDIESVIRAEYHRANGKR